MSTGTKRGRKPNTQLARPLPNKIREFRLARGLTLKQCGDAIGVTAQAIFQAEKYGYISKEHLFALSDILGIKNPRELEKERVFVPS